MIYFVQMEILVIRARSYCTIHTTPLFLRTPNPGHYASPNPILSHKAHLDSLLFRHVSIDDVLIFAAFLRSL